MLQRGFFTVKLVCDREQDDVKRLAKQIRHIVSSQLQNTIVEEVEWEQTEDVLPMPINDDV
jgi:phosphoribosylformylglycinamidine (FGAM) synthase PurS component